MARDHGPVRGRRTGVKIAVVGASGGTGRAAVERALAHGHEVTAIARDTSQVGVTHERLQVVRGDVRDEQEMRSTIPGHDAVLVAIGAKPARSVDLYSEGIANILYAMAESNVPRLVVVSAAGTFHRSDPSLTRGYKVLMRTALKGLYDDLERMEQRIMASSLEWVIVRPSGLTDGSFTGEYRLGGDGRPLSGGGTISRNDVAAFMLKSAETNRWVRSAVTISY